MNEKIREKGQYFAKFLESLPQAERTRGNQLQLQQAEAEHRQFRNDFHHRSCYLCHKPLASFTTNIPCLHWLLKPSGFKKSDFLTLIKKYGFFQTQTYLRWVANEEAFARNINDMSEEGTGKLFETTIRYKNLEWSFSCTESDYLGHSESNHAAHPHYHFQMRIDNRPFIDYSDFHIPFKENEIISIEAMRTAPGTIKLKFPFGEGMQDILTDETVEHIVNTTVPEASSEESAPFKIDTLIMADEGKTISSEDLYKIIQDAKEKKVTVASLMHKVPNANVRVLVTPGPGVVEQAPRTKRKKRKS
ncbi:MAG TPA: hypothetical protein VFT64_11835 [Rickettsiales bacterium]|nr:hypothetical protein [Rickettsiales bacterium]